MSILMMRQIEELQKAVALLQMAIAELQEEMSNVVARLAILEMTAEVVEEHKIEETRPHPFKKDGRSKPWSRERRFAASQRAAARIAKAHAET